MEQAREATHTLPDIVLERYRLAELPSDAMRRVATAIDTSEELRSRLAAIDVSDADARTVWPTYALARMVLARRQAAARPMVGRWVVPAGAVLAAAVLVMVSSTVFRPRGLPSEPGAGSDERIKGVEASLLVFRQADGGGAQLGEDTVVRAGDLLRLGYRVAHPGYGVIVSVDGRGVLTRHLPAEGTEAARLQTGQTMLLDDAFEIDDAPTLERFYLISGERPFHVDPVVDAVQAAARTAETTPLHLPPSLTFTTFTLRKDPHP